MPPRRYEGGMPAYLLQASWSTDKLRRQFYGSHPRLSLTVVHLAEGLLP